MLVNRSQACERLLLCERLFCQVRDFQLEIKKNTQHKIKNTRNDSCQLFGLN